MLSDTQLGVACDIELRQRRDRILPHLWSDFLQTKDDIEQDCHVRGLALAMRAQEEEAAVLLVFF